MQILIVDSSIRIIERLTEVVSEAENITAIHRAVSYEEAKKLFKENKYDTVLLDIELPGSESFIFLKEIKRISEKTFVIILLTPVNSYLEEVCKSLGPDSFFDKYDNFKRIRRLINSIGQRAKTQSISSEIPPTAVIREPYQQGLATNMFKNPGLCEAITNLVRDATEASPVKIFLELAGFREHTVSNKFKLNVFRIVQEQLDNILKHAKATEVTINLSQTKNSTVLSISDNGVGFDTGQKQTGTGIDDIKSRAVSYNGIAVFVSQSGRGCILTVTFPVADTS